MDIASTATVYYLLFLHVDWMARTNTRARQAVGTELECLTSLPSLLRLRPVGCRNADSTISNRSLTGLNSHRCIHCAYLMTLREFLVHLSSLKYSLALAVVRGCHCRKATRSNCWNSASRRLDRRQIALALVIRFSIFLAFLYVYVVPTYLQGPGFLRYSFSKSPSSLIRR